MKAAGRVTMRSTNHQEPHTHRGPGTDATAMRGAGSSVSARLTAPLSSHYTAVRKRQSAASAHGGAGDGGVNVGGAFGKTSLGRRLGGTESGKASNTITPRLEQPTIASALRAASNRQTIREQRERAAAEVAASVNKSINKVSATRTKGGIMGASASIATGLANTKKERDRLANPLTKQATRARLWAPKKPTGNPVVTAAATVKKDKRSTLMNDVKSVGNFETGVVNDHADDHLNERQLDMTTQTNEAEILDHNLLSGNMTILQPSPELIVQIEKARRDAKAKAERQSMRRFTPHEQDEEQHLDELKEFMERNAVTKRTPKKPPPITYGTYDHQFSNVFKSMDDFFRSEVPKSESITNIKERIKRKEVELMSLFDNMDNMAEKSDFEYEL